MNKTHINTLFSPVTVGRCTLKNRLVMAPMTRCRAKQDGTPSELAIEYYEQRAQVGLIISEGTQPSADGQGYLTTPGIYTEAHVDGWKKIIEAVHAKGALMYIQLMHAGRMCHPDNTPHHRQSIAPSAIAPGVQIFTAKGMQDIPAPRALTTQEILQTVENFRYAARCAIDAGADGVEIHGANGYLVQQFFAPNANTRTDEYCGSIENRARFAIDVAKAITEEIGADRTAIRLSPGTTISGIDEGEEGSELYRYLVTQLNQLGLSYMHLMGVKSEDLLDNIRRIWKSVLILNRPNRPHEQMGSDIAAKIADLEAYGKLILANPDFVERVKTGTRMNTFDASTFYVGGAHGYTDYPFLENIK